LILRVYSLSQDIDVRLRTTVRAYTVFDEYRCAGDDEDHKRE